MTKQDTRKLLAKNLRDLMSRDRSLDTQVKVAQRAGIAQSTVGRLLRGEVYAQLSQVEALAEAFRVDVAVLLKATTDRDENRTEVDEIAGYASLSTANRKQVADFVAFLAQRAEERAGDSILTASKTIESEEALKQRLMHAIQREFDDHTLNIANEREESETKATKRSRNSPAR